MPFRAGIEARLSQACPVRRLGSPPVHVGDPASRESRTTSVSDLWKMRVLLDAAVRAEALAEPVAGRFLGHGVRVGHESADRACEELHALGRRALYRMWNQGVSSSPGSCCATSRLVSTPEAGLYFRGEEGVASDKPKMALTAFRFPFVAFRQPAKKSVMYWGRSPAALGRDRRAEATGRARRGDPASEQVRDLQGRHASTATTGFLRARLANGKDSALLFSLVVPPDRPVCPWGTC